MAARSCAVLALITAAALACGAPAGRRGAAGPAFAGATGAAPRTPPPAAEVVASRPAPADPPWVHRADAVWLTDALYKIQPRDRPRSEPLLVLPLARNEVESFQVHVTAKAPLDAVVVSVSDWVHESGATLPAARHAVVARVAYQDVSVPSTRRGLRGPVPDVLVPERDELFGEPRRAFPTSVPAGETRSAWIDVHVPKGAPSGMYVAAVEVTAAGALLARMPVYLRVWAFELPSTPPLRTYFPASPLGFCIQAFGGYEGCRAMEGAGGDADVAVELSHVLMARFLLDRRISDGEVAYARSLRRGWDHFDNVFGPLLDGTAPTRLEGARLTTFAYVGAAEDGDLLRRHWDHARARGYADRLVYYHCDEPPHDCTFAQAEREARLLSSVAPGLPVLLTARLSDVRAAGLAPLIGILAPNVAHVHPFDGPSLAPDYEAFRRQNGAQVFWYQDCSQHESCEDGHPGPAAVLWPSYAVDAGPVENRIFQWLAFLYGVDGELYFSVDHCWDHPCGGKTDPLASVYAHGGHGDGTLVYPGLPSRIGGTRPTVMPSVRLAHIRDGIEDHAYLSALSAAGERAFAEGVARSFITDAHHFALDPRRLRRAREALGERLHALAVARAAHADVKPPDLVSSPLPSPSSAE